MMLPPPVIQVIPSGLLGLLGLKNGGSNPPYLNSNVQPTFELSEYYLRANFRIVTDAQVWAAAVGTGISLFASGVFTVPQNEIWYVDDVAGAVSTGAADTLGQFGLFMVGQGSGAWPVTDLLPAMAINQSRWVGSRRSFWMTSGMQLGYACFNGVTAGVQPVAAYMRVAKIPV
jgi:hypothetical protein